MPIDSFKSLFKSPPVVEVAMGIIFEPIPAMAQAHFGEFFSRLRRNPNYSSFTTVDQPPLDHVIRGPQGNTTTVPFSNLPRLRRSWFFGESSNILLQLQNDRLVQNWRGDYRTYPGFPDLLSQFHDNFKILQKMIEDFKLGVINGKQVELSYVNSIPSKDPRHILASFQLSDFLDKDRTKEITFENLSFSVPVGSSNLQIQWSQNPLQLGSMLALNYREQIASVLEDRISESFSRGHKGIVETFSKVVSTQLLKEWGYQK